MLGRVLSGPALFLMERGGGGRWLLRLERSRRADWEGGLFRLGLTGKQLEPS